MHVGRGGERAADCAVRSRRSGRCSARSATWRPSRSAAWPVDHRADMFALGRHPLRDGVRPARVSARYGAGNDDGDPERAPAGSDRDRPLDSTGPRTDRQSLSREEPVGEIPDRQRPRVCARGVVGRVGFIARCRACSAIRTARARMDRVDHRGVAAAGAGAPRLSTRPRAACPVRPDAVSDSADRGAGGAGEFQPVSGRPPSGVLWAWHGWRPASPAAVHGYAGRSAVARNRAACRHGRGSSFLVA